MFAMESGLPNPEPVRRRAAGAGLGPLGGSPDEGCDALLELVSFE